MVDVTATAVDPNQQLTIYFGGQFDQTMMGAPVYFWAIFIMGMMLICGGLLVMYYRYFILDKVWAFVECYKKRTPLALIRTRYRKAYLKSLRYVAQVFVDDETNDMWTAPALETSSNLEGVNLIEAVDYYDWLQDPILNQAIHELIAEWNEKNPEDKIITANDFQKKLSDGMLGSVFDGHPITTYVTKGKVPVPAFFFVDIAKIEQYLPRNRSSTLLAGVAQKMGNDLGNKDKIDPKTALYVMAGGATLIIISAIIAYVILKG
jgi:hypothetical protein